MKIRMKIGSETQKIIQLAFKAKRSVMLVGSHGIGKSESVKDAAAELEIECIVIDLSIMEPTDLVGLPFNKDGRTVYAPPKFLPTDGEGILMIEEINRAPRYVRAPILQLLTERRLNDYVLPEGWVVMAAINPPEDGYDGDDLDPALMSRFCVVEVEPDHKNFLQYAKENNLHQQVQAYVKANPHLFEQPGQNPRAYKYVSDLLIAAENEKTSKKVIFAAVAGYIQEPHAKALLEFDKVGLAKNTESTFNISSEDVIKEFAAHKPLIEEITASGRLDLLSGLTEDVITAINAKYPSGLPGMEAGEQKNVKDFFDCLPKDMSKKYSKEINL